MSNIPKAAILNGLKLLPTRLDTPSARVMLAAIGLQESRFTARRQLVGSPPRPVGPAKSYWQAEQGGGMIHGVRVHGDTQKLAAEVYRMCDVEAKDAAIWDAVENDDVLAAALARLLLWTDPKAIPDIGKEEDAFQMYLNTWRPGAYTRGDANQRAALRSKWASNYAEAVRVMA